MRAIYKRELRGYLTSMTGYIFMAVLLAVAGLYYTANCLVGGIRSLELFCPPFILYCCS